MELESKNILCGAVGMVYAIFIPCTSSGFIIVPTLLIVRQEFGLTIGSELFSAVYPKGRGAAIVQAIALVVLDYFQGFWTAYNGSSVSVGVSAPAVFYYAPVNPMVMTNIVKGLLLF
jgi:hypothetical protein